MCEVIQLSKYRPFRQPEKKFRGFVEYHGDNGDEAYIATGDGFLNMDGTITIARDGGPGLNGARFDTMTEAMDFIRHAEVHGLEAALALYWEVEHDFCA